MNTNKLQLIIDYKLSNQEALALKIALLWEELSRKYFPKEKGLAMIGTGDPRKSSLFKDCWKVVRETNGLLKQEDYRWYIVAQLTGLKLKGGYLSPKVLHGDKAWVRWKIWNWLYQKKKLEAQGQITEPAVHVESKIILKLETTKRFLFEKCDGEPTIEKYQGFIDDKSLNIWILNGKVSYFYLMLSPWIQKLINLDELAEKLKFDTKLYLDKLLDENKQMKKTVLTYFEREFNHEFR